MLTQETINTHFENLAGALGGVKATDSSGSPIILPCAYNRVIKHMRERHSRGGKLIFIGNGGSAAIASHMAIDYAKNGGIRATAFNDASLLTCLSNDCGYEMMFVHALDCYADKGDILVAISSSGESKNIVNAADHAKKLGCMVYTLSGFSEKNLLRMIGDINFYVPTKKGEYGFTEIAHLAVLHSILDMICLDIRKEGK